MKPLRPTLLAVLTALAALGSTLLSGCAGSQVQDYTAERPLLDLRQYFNGDLVAHGMFTDRFGTIRRRFTVQMKAHWQGNSGVLEEDFLYSDGEKERRVWTLQRQADGSYIGKAADVVGEAEGRAAGPVLRWQYTLSLPVGGSRYQVAFDDWMVLMDEHTLLNRATMSKWGVRLGEVTLAFHKP
jgi:hypothetical protein